jgi:hypothetical protein
MAEPQTLPLEVDENGMVIGRPVLGWTAAPVVSETSVILRLWFAETPAEVQTGGRSVQVALTAPQALELAELLARQGHIAAQVPPGRRN